jgi:hypothetical protein
MKRTNLTSIALLAALLLPCLATVAIAGAPGPFHQNIRSLGMGGAGVATGKGVESMVYNPALLAQVPFDLAIPRLRIEISDDMLEVIKFAVDHQDEFAEFEDLEPGAATKFLDDMAPFDDQWVNFMLAPAIGLSLQRIGFLGYSSTQLGVRLDKGIYSPRVYAEGYSDNVFTGGLSLPATPRLDIGVGIKYIDRRSSGLIKLSASALGDNQEVLEEVNDQIEESKTGFGVDIGGIYEFTDAIDIGFVLQDFLGKVGDDDLSLNVKAGVAWELAPGITLAGDLVDLMNRRSDSAFKKVHLGAEFDIPIVKARFGLSQGYPTIGLGLSLLILQFDYAFYGYERGLSTGDTPEWRHAIQLGLGW